MTAAGRASPGGRLLESLQGSVCDEGQSQAAGESLSQGKGKKDREGLFREAKGYLQFLKCIYYFFSISRSNRQLMLL